MLLSVTTNRLGLWGLSDTRLGSEEVLKKHLCPLQALAMLLLRLFAVKRS